jgi:Flp pilus assembly protein TadG
MPRHRIDDYSGRKDAVAVRHWWRWQQRRGRGLRDRRGTTALEFAILSVPFLLMVLFAMEIAYDLYTQAALDSGMQSAIRQIQTGNAQNVTTGNAFLTQYVCPSMTAVLNCSTNTYISVQAESFGSTGSATSYSDYYGATTGNLPLFGNTLSLTNFGAGAFCNGQPNQYLLLTAIYIGPTFVGGLLPRVISEVYQNKLVHATLSTAAVVLENFTKTQAATGTTPAGSC